MARAKKITAKDYVMVSRYQGFALVLWNKQSFFPANFSPSNLKTSLYRKSFQVTWIWRSFGLFLAPYCEYFGNIFSFFNFFTRCSSWRELQQCEFSLRKIKTFIGIDYIWFLYKRRLLTLIGLISPHPYCHQVLIFFSFPYVIFPRQNFAEDFTLWTPFMTQINVI